MRAAAAFAFALGVSSVVLLSGCGGMANPMLNPILSEGPSPRVEDCMMIGQGTPAKFACPPEGKVYTSTQLTNIRLGKPM